MRYEKDFVEKALKSSDEIGVKKTAEKFKIPYATLCGWRAHREPTDEKDLRIAELEGELMDLKRANRVLQDALSYIIDEKRGGVAPDYEEVDKLIHPEK